MCCTRFSWDVNQISSSSVDGVCSAVTVNSILLIKSIVSKILQAELTVMDLWHHWGYLLRALSEPLRTSCRKHGNTFLSFLGFLTEGSCRITKGPKQIANINWYLWYLSDSFLSACVFLQTYIGNMLLSINPFKPLNIYTDELRQKYQCKEQQKNPPWANTSHSAARCPPFSSSLTDCVSSATSVSCTFDSLFSASATCMP